MRTKDRREGGREEGEKALAYDGGVWMYLLSRRASLELGDWLLFLF